MKGLLVKDLLLLKMQKSFIILAFVICALLASSDSDSIFPSTFLISGLIGQPLKMQSTASAVSG